MRLFYFILLIILITSCTQEKIKIESSEAEGNIIDSAYIRTTGINADEDIQQIAKEPEIGVLSPKLAIISPKDNDLIKSSEVTVELKAENFKLVPVGEPVKEGEGHFHVWLDSEKKLGHQTTFTFENVASGKYSIVAELVKSDHSLLIPKVAKSITINVESDYVPKIEQQTNEFTIEADDNGFYPNKIQAKINDTIKINFKFRDDSIYFAGLDIKGPFPTIQYKLKWQHPLTAEFTMKDETKIISYWPSSGVKKAELIVEI